MRIIEVIFSKRLTAKKISFYYNYDNKIIQGKNNQEDYGYVLSLLLDLK
jgi:hypothetical protein